ncbi:MAG TPA: S8 family serine peptidase [Pseudobdellovibrionaceae bacterium]|nr:S8 family serine peptidase [Pseudobdellovibrionaceae bacterium]
MMQWILCLSIFLSSNMGLSANIEATANVAVSTPIDVYNWGLHNKGLPQNIDIDRMYTYKSQATPNEDIRFYSFNTPPLRKIKVAVLDTGLDLNHPLLEPFIYKNTLECESYEKYKLCLQEKSQELCNDHWLNLKNPQVDLDKNGYPLDCQGWSTVSPKTINENKILGHPLVNDPVGHGTHVTGLITFVSPHVEIIPVQVLSTNPNSPTRPASLNPEDLIKKEVNESDFKELPPYLSNILIRGLLYAIKSGAEVISLSMGWSWEQDSSTMRSLIAEAQKRGIIFIAASGNDATKTLIYPCAYSGVICVGSHNPDGSISHFSNHSSGVDLLAPGLNILSTFPMDLKAKSFRGDSGYEYLSGSSQSTPFVTGVVAEMLSYGIPKSEIYSRLVLGSRNIKNSMDLLMGAPHLQTTTVPPYFIDSKKILGGSLDMTKAIQFKPQPHIVPLEKTPFTILWDGHSRQLLWEVEFINRWIDFNSDQIKLTTQWLSPTVETLRPSLKSIQPFAKFPSIWKTNEIRKYVIEFEIQDSTEPEKTRISSELEISFQISANTQYQFEYPLEARIVHQLSLERPPLNSFTFNHDQPLPISRPPITDIEYLPIFKTHDNEIGKRDYLVKTIKKSKTSFQLLKQTTEESYQLSSSFNLKLKESSDNYSLSYLERIDWDQDGQSEYFLGFKSLKKNADSKSWAEFFIINSKTDIIQKFEYIYENAPLPSQFFWLKTGHTFKPAWVGPGYDTHPKPTLWTLWEKENLKQIKNRFFYFQENQELRSITQFQGYDVVDILDPKFSNTNGKLTLLMAKNLGSSLNPSYHSSYALALVGAHGIEKLEQLNTHSELKLFQNLFERSKGLIQNLDLSDLEYKGTYWSTDSLPKTQDLLGFNFFDQKWIHSLMEPLRKPFDSLLSIKSVFWSDSSQIQGAYGLTLTEIQYTDFLKSKSIQHSLERYTFYPTGGFNKILFSTMVLDLQNNTRWPALYLTEDSRMGLGMKVYIPYYENELPKELIIPAKLRISTGGQCTPFPQPLFLGSKGAYALDYLCQGKILRLPLEY